MSRFVLFATILLAAASTIAQTSSRSDAAGGQIGPDAVWSMPSDFIANAHKTCDNAPQPPSFAQCFMAQMSKAGASALSVSFTKELYRETDGEVGILSALHQVGPVDIAWIVYPLRANTNSGLLFVNGKPAILNAEDLKLLDQNAMKQSFQFQDLQNQFPQVSLWPGDRDGKTWPNSQMGTQGGVQFVLGYPLRNGCHACASAGFALFNWNFDASGKFLGTTFLGFTPPPLPGANTSPSGTAQQ